MSQDKPLITNLDFEEEMAELKKIVEIIKSYSDTLEASSIISSNGKSESESK